MNHNITRALCAGILVTASAMGQAASISGMGTWETTLQARDLDGNASTAEAYYDTVLGITWLADAGSGSLFEDWDDAVAWVSGLDIGGYNDWRLPKVGPVDGTTADDNLLSNIGTEDRGYNISAPGTLYAGSTASELAHLHYNTLGNFGYCNVTTSTESTCGYQPSFNIKNLGPFTNVAEGYYYWTGTGYALNPAYVWNFYFEFGLQNRSYKLAFDHYAWAVHDGDIGTLAVAPPPDEPPPISEVPVPAAAWLLGSGLAGLFGARRGRSHA